MALVTLQLHTFTVNLRTREDRDALTRLMAAYDYFETQREPETTPALARGTADVETAPATPAPSRSALPPLGQRSIDYLLRAAVKFAPGTHFSAIFPQMQALGWQTASQSPRAIINNLSSSCRKHADLVQVANERVTLTEAGRVFVQTLPPLPPVSYVTPEAP